MAQKFSAPRGTQDLLPQDSYKWRFLERRLMEIAEAYGYREIRIPTFEHTELFIRSVGESTDVVGKEMYTFEDKGGRSITLRPEGTAGTVRAAIEHGLLAGAMPLRLCYLLSCFRYEKPQAGRLREFHQFGVECFGAADAAADAELIHLAGNILSGVGVRDLSLEINSIGCPTCRKAYLEKLRTYFQSHYDELCDTCKGRLETNPLRILDCKSPVCKAICEGAPVIVDSLCDDCKEHFRRLQEYLTAMDMPFTVNPHIVRGLDYYTRTVFEFVSSQIGAQGTVCGGGRYDGLVEEMGGNPTPGLGFGMGLERLMLVLEAQGVELPAQPTCDVYLAGIGDAASRRAFLLAQELKEDGLHAQSDLCGRGLKAQMKYADKIGAKYAVVLGDEELQSGTANLKNMLTGETTQVPIDGIGAAVTDGIMDRMRDEMTDDVDKEALSKLFGGMME